MTADEIKICTSLKYCVTHLPGTWNKRFANNLAAQAENKPESDLTEKQKEWMYRLLYTYRRQVPELYNQFKDHPHCKKL